MKARMLGLGLVAAIVVAAGGLRLAQRSDTTTPQAAQPQEALPLRISGPGTVQARVPVTVSARVSALVVAVHADHGERVKRGQLLAVLDDRDLAAKRAAASAGAEAAARNTAAAEATLAKAQAELELARNRQARDLELIRAGFISRSAYDASSLGLKAAQAGLDNAAALLSARRSEVRALAQEAQYAEAAWSHTRISAPMDAIVIQRSAEVGAMAVPGAPLFRLVDPATLWVAARIDESLVGGIEEGMPATIRLRSGGEYAGRVARISRQSDAATRELEVNVAFDAPPGRFAIDQEAEVSILARWTSR